MTSSKTTKNHERTRTMMFALPQPSKSPQDVHETVINAPAHVVWESLADINNWRSWNRWVRLDSEKGVQSGNTGHSRQSMDGNGRWQRKRRFNFNVVSRKELVFSWTTRTSELSTSINSVKLIPLGSTRTRIEHIQSTQGLFSPFQRLLSGRCYDRSQRHCLYMNEALKHHVEGSYFKSLLYTLSTRQMERSDSTLETSSLELDCTGGYWDTPRNLRNELISCYIGDQV